MRFATFGMAALMRAKIAWMGGMLFPQCREDRGQARVDCRKGGQHRSLGRLILDLKVRHYRGHRRLDRGNLLEQRDLLCGIHFGFALDSRIDLYSSLGDLLVDLHDGPGFIGCHHAGLYGGSDDVEQALVSRRDDRHCLGERLKSRVRTRRREKNETEEESGKNLLHGSYRPKICLSV